MMIHVERITFTPPNIICFFIVYELDTGPGDLNSNFTLKYCLFTDVELAKMLIQISTFIVVTVLDSIRVENFH